MNELYKKIGKIAHSASSPMTFEKLGKELGLTTNERGVANHVTGAYNYFQEKRDINTATKITGVFTKKDGSYAYID